LPLLENLLAGLLVARNINGFGCLFLLENAHNCEQNTGRFAGVGRGSQVGIVCLLVEEKGRENLCLNLVQLRNL
jgi:hypothetical protein